MILVIGSGVAGLSCALAAVDAGAKVELVTAGASPAVMSAAADLHTQPGTLRGLGECNTALAQGGIAAVVSPNDSIEAHLADTLAAGAGIVDAEAAETLVRDGSASVHALLASGFSADRDVSGELRLGLEAAHSAARIVHGRGDQSGAVLHAHLSARAIAAAREGRLILREAQTAVSLFEDAGVVTGAVLRDAAGALTLRQADAVVLATGGYAALFPRTSNAAGATGEGIVLAARSGALVADLEFVQFHPTVLSGTGKLVSEAVRGAGAVLRDGAGRRFMKDIHAQAELAPRDVVSRAIHCTLRDRGETAVWLDASHIETAEGSGALSRRFPGITAMLMKQGFDWTREAIPVAPAAHYTMGGVVSDLDGRSTVPGLFVAGEVASTGVHGANRLASNSLLEGLVFGERAGRAAAAFAQQKIWELRGDGAKLLSIHSITEKVPQPDRIVAGHEQVMGLTSQEAVADAVETGLGIERDAAGLREAALLLDGASGLEAELATMVLRSAEWRTESRGAHQRSDFPAADPRQASRRAFRFDREHESASAVPGTGTTAHAEATNTSDPRSKQGSLTSC